MKDGAEKTLKRGSLASIFFGVITILMCELPIILALGGLGALSAATSEFRPPIWVEVVGISVAIAGFLMLIIRWRNDRRGNNQA